MVSTLRLLAAALPAGRRGAARRGAARRGAAEGREGPGWRFATAVLQYTMEATFIHARVPSLLSPQNTIYRWTEEAAF